MKSKNKKIWDQYGLTDEGAELADKLMPKMLEVAKAAGTHSAYVYDIFEEALFQVYELPKRTKEFQEEYTWQDSK